MYHLATNIHGLNRLLVGRGHWHADLSLITIQYKVNSPRTERRGLLDISSILIKQEAREGAILPGAAIDGTTMQPEPHLVTLEERQDGVVAGSFMIWGSIIGIGRHHHLLIAHEINVEWHIDGELQDVEDEDVGSISRAGEAANVGVVRLPQVTVNLVKHNGLVQVAGGKVCSARGSECHSQRLGEWVELHRKQSSVMVSVGSERDFQGGDG